MPDINASLESTWIFGDSLVACRDPAVTLDLSDDYLIFDNQVEATYRQEGTRTLGRDGKITSGNVRTVHLCHVGRYKVTFRDLLSEASGHLKVGDIRAELSLKELDGLAPQTGDKITLPDGDYNVFAVDWDNMVSMYIVWCRR